MNEKFERLEALLKEDGKIQEIFCGNAEEILNKLDAYGISLSLEELNDIKDGFNDAMGQSEELSEELLDNVAGGCKDCSSAGYDLGREIGKWMRKIKNFFCFWDW